MNQWMILLMLSALSVTLPQRAFQAQLTLDDMIEYPEGPSSPTSERPGNRDDPAYATYKEGYALILDERWEQARKKFPELLAKYKKSDYRDDATYWSAYALKHLSLTNALKAYEDFLHRYPASSYFDDALADLAELQARASVLAPVAEPESLSIAVDVEAAPDPQIARSYSYTIKRLGHELRKTSHNLRREFRPMRTMIVAPNPSTMLKRELATEKLDRQTRLKLEALSALGAMKQDPQSVTTLKEIALDRTQPRELRHVSLYSLSRLKDADVLPVFLEIARKDTDSELQVSAVYGIVQSGLDKRKTLDILTDMYRSTPERRTEQLEIVLDAIATIGTERGVDFLVGVARTSNDPELASIAIDGIGQTPDDKKKVVETLITLYGETPKTRNEQRGTILYTIADVGGDRAVDFLSTVALSDDDGDLRGNAIYLLGTIGGEKARTTLYRILKGK